MINGNTQGIRDALLDELEAIYDIPTNRDEFISRELIEALAKYTGLFGREISVYIGRSGAVIDVSVGDSYTVSLSNLRLRRSQERLSGLRCVHTHPNGDATLSDVDLQSLLKLRFDAMAALGVREGKPSALSCAFIEPNSAGKLVPVLEAPRGVYSIPQEEWMRRIYDADLRIGQETATQTQDERERALLVGLDDPQSETMQELRSLAETANVDVAGFAYQKKSTLDPATYIGKGKAQEISLTIQAQDVQVCIFNDELSGAQIRNLEQILGCRVIDRTMLILDIFASRAQSREGKLQVELAQLKYNSSRLTGLGTVLSRLGGGIGTRGPGETKLETDRRHIRARINQIEREIDAIDKHRATRRARRERNEVPVAALVGYTNAGKSTLLNALSGADVYVQDALFATLDPTTRSIILPGGGQCLLVDTVGFISKLPHALIDAFKSTLEEALYADLLVIVSDASSPNLAQQQLVVDEVLDQLGAAGKPRLTALNKIDRAPLPLEFPPHDAVCISAKSDIGLGDLLTAIEKKLYGHMIRAELTIPYTKSNAMAFIHKYGKVTSEQYEQTGTIVKFTIDEISYGRLLKMLND